MSNIVEIKTHMSDDIKTLNLNGVNDEEAYVLIEDFVLPHNAPFKILFNDSVEVNTKIHELLVKNDINYIIYGGNDGYIFATDKEGIKEANNRVQADIENINKLIERNKIFQSRKYKKNKFN